MTKRIAMLTGGGDVPGLNSCVKGLTQGALERGWEAVGFRSGWQGVLSCNPDDEESVARWTLSLDSQTVRKVDRYGGTFLHSSRVNPGSVADEAVPDFLRDSPHGTRRPNGDWDFTAHALRVLEALKIDVLFPIGGDDTLGYGERLHREGMHIVGIPKTMDNDVNGTDYCLGFGTCVARCVEYIQHLRTSTGSHERIAVVEIMGRNAGFTSLVPAYIAGVDRALIAEVPFDIDRLASLLADDRQRNPSNYAMVTVSEGARFADGEVVERGEADAFGHKKLGGVGVMVGEAIKARTGIGIISQSLGYLVRSGPPDPIDVMVTLNFANVALELAEREEFGRLVTITNGVYSHAPITVVAEAVKRVDIETLYDAENYRPRMKSMLGLPLYLGH